jgi:hypothetical protein
MFDAILSRLSLRQVIGIPVRRYRWGAQTRIRALERLGLPRFETHNTHPAEHIS